ncbi:type I restriction-modification system [Vibrio sp. JCM 19236]|nr:type I restriction-modification system [Vibrio sp. JCM 19236]
MVSQTNEQALEAAIEKALSGTCTEELKAGVAFTKVDYGDKLYQIGQPTDFDMHYALDSKLFWQFLGNTQEKELEKLKRSNPIDWQRKVLERFDRLIKNTVCCTCSKRD